MDNSTAFHKESSRRKTKVDFPPTFVFRPLTPPYMRIRIRRFLIYNDTFRSIPTMTDSLLARGFYCSLQLALSHYAPLHNIPCSHFPIGMPYSFPHRIWLDYELACVGVSNFSIYTYGYDCEAIHLWLAGSLLRLHIWSNWPNRGLRYAMSPCVVHIPFRYSSWWAVSVWLWT